MNSWWTAVGRARRAGLVLAALCAIGLPGVAGDRFVDDDACPGPGTGTDIDPYCTIQSAICDLESSGGGTVHVRPGLYQESIRMYAGISVISTDGAAVTTIDGTGRTCIDDVTCAPLAMGRCAVVLIDVGTTPSDRLEGFRIQGGRGVPRAFGPGIDNATSGGGVFVYDGSPTITANLITGNAPSGAFSRQLGGGIYVNGDDPATPAQPVITNNRIINNIVDNTVPGVYGYSQAVGGGIFVGSGASPRIEGNIISNNSVLGAQIRSGGGIMVYSISDTVEPRITRNRISDNTSTGFGGGVVFSYVQQGPTIIPSRGLFDNNLVQFNTANTGGGLAAAATRARLHNNTFIENEATQGAAMSFLPSSEPTDQAEVVNNLIVLNTDGLIGGVQVSSSSPTFRNNDLFANTPVNINVPGVIGVDGNVSVDPQIFDLGNIGQRDLHLRATSPLIDAGDVTVAGTLDLDGDPRVQMAGVDIGCFETGDVDEDGILNHLDNCPDDPNPDQSDVDGDSIGDLCDTNTDVDGDNVDDALDSAPLDPFVCTDDDGDGCDDCVTGTYDPNDDGPDNDLDGMCDAGDIDDDNDGVQDFEDSDPFDEFVCGDSEPDTCEDCALNGMSTPNDDGPDADGDGLCDAGDQNIDMDGDGIDDLIDSAPEDPFECIDRDGDNCDDCTSGSWDPFDDGPDFDLDGICDLVDVDDDNDDVTDVADCEPMAKGVSAAPGEVSTVRMSGGAQGDIGWLPGDQGHTFNLYRGQLDPGQAWTWNTQCRIAEAPTTLVSDPDLPPSGALFYYLIASRNACGESGVGAGSGLMTRPQPPACAELNADTDTDGVLDNFDSCPTVDDPTLADDDFDFIGNPCDNCPGRANPDQRDTDQDGIGDACDFT